MLATNLKRQSCKDQAFVINTLKVELKELRQLAKNKEMCASSFCENLKNVTMKT